MKLSPHFSLDEMIFSQTAARRGISNIPPDDALRNLYMTADLLEKVRSIIRVPIFVSSGYRSEWLNTAIGGSSHSSHKTGEAADILAPGFGSPYALAEIIAVSDLDFDQCILEFSRWTHVSISDNPRRQVLTARKRDGVTVYEGGLIKE